MFRRIGSTVVRHPVWTIVAWLIAAVAIVATAPSLPSNSDESSFLPKSYESIKAADLQQKAFPSAFTPSAIALYQRTDGGRLTAADMKDVARITTELGGKHIDQVQKVVPGPPSKDGRYALTLVQMDSKNAGQPKQTDAAKVLRDDVKQLAKGTHLDVKLGGSAAQALDQQDSSKRGQALIGFGTFAIILVTLLIIFRAPILAVLPLVLIGLVSAVANGLIAYATKLFDLQANSSISSILIVVLFGVGTDYFLFLMFRYRERLRAGDEAKEAMINAVGRVGEAIASAAGAVIIAFLALVLSTLGFLKQMGPALAIAVGATLVAGLTLIPAVVSLIGPKVFWPSKSWQREPENARFAALGRGVQRRPALTAGVSGLVLLALSVGIFGYHATFDLASGSMPKTKESMVVQDQMQKAYSAGAAAPTDVYLSSTDGKPLDKSGFAAYAQKLGAVDGVANARMTQLNKDGTTADFTVTLKYEASTDKAIDAVGKVRDVAHANAPDGTKAVVGGMSSIYKDINTAVNHDYKTVFPVAAILIMVILGLLLRSVVALVPDGLGGPRLRRHPRCHGVDLPEGRGPLGADVHAPGDHVSVRRRHRHRLQHPHDRPAPGGGPRGPRAARGGRHGTAARRADRGRGRLHPGGDLRHDDAGGQLAAHGDGFRGLLRHRRRGLRHGDVLHPEPHRADRPRRVVAGARGPGGGGGRRGGRFRPGCGHRRLPGRPRSRRAPQLAAACG